MIIKQQHTNGTVLCGVYSRNEMGEAEKAKARLQYGKSWDDVDHATVWRNKRGEITRVDAEYAYERDDNTLGLIDALKTVYGNRSQKKDGRRAVAERAARIGMSETEALRVIRYAYTGRED